jgi:transposase
MCPGFVLAGRMRIMSKAFPREFRDDVVAVARKGEASIAQIAKDFGVSESCPHRWLQLADVGCAI